MEVSRGKSRFRISSERFTMSECVAMKARLPYCPSINNCRLNPSPSMSFAYKPLALNSDVTHTVRSSTARLMLATIQIAFPSRRYAFTTPSLAELSSRTPGASTKTAPLRRASQGPLNEIFFTRGQKAISLTSFVESAYCSISSRKSFDVLEQTRKEAYHWRIFFDNACRAKATSHFVFLPNERLNSHIFQVNVLSINNL